MKELYDGTKVTVVEHPTLNVSRCVVSCRDAASMSEAELFAELEEQGVKEVRRITRKNGPVRENTPSIVITVRGTIIPPYIDFGFIRCRTRPYYPAPLQCFQCWDFGHTGSRCQAKKPICGNCSRTHPIAEDKSCQQTRFCYKCESSEHALSERSCPLYKGEFEIQRIKVDQGLSYAVAKRAFEARSGPKAYATVTQVDNEENTALLSRIDQLTTQHKEKDNIIEELRNARCNQRQLANEVPPIRNSSGSPYEQLRILVDEQSAQIAALTDQVSNFLAAVMPAQSISTISNTPPYHSSDRSN
ncbi:uncharacterized protein LOC134206908 [Armigeres subalbatus]|uniref:uncharacterized protein LOC134206908 n=1 Tax=Armigeres subalbatus TaxID=124917 RepID=UPI002ED1EDC9